MPSFKLPQNLDLPIDTEAVTTAARDGVYIAVGTGVLAFQRAQVLRRDLQKRAESVDIDFAPADWANSAVSAGRSTLHEFRGQVSNLGDVPAVHAIDGQVLVVEDRVDVVLDAVEANLPTAAQFALNTVREAAKDSGAQVRVFIGLSA